MKSRLLTPMLAGMALLSGCASIVDGGPEQVQVTSKPLGAKFTVYDKAGTPVESRTTPACVTLKRDSGYCKPADYTIKFEADGYNPDELKLRARMNGWYIGNIIFGGPIGILIVDPATGAMWTLPDKRNCNLVAKDKSLSLEKLSEMQLIINPDKRTEEQTIEIAKKLISGGKSEKEIAAEMNMEEEKLHWMLNPRPE